MPIPLIYNPIYSYTFPNQHRFPMQKFRYLYEYVNSQGLVSSNQSNVFRPGKLKIEHLSSVHCPDYVSRFLSDNLDRNEQRRMGLPWSNGLAQRTLVAPNGTLLAASIAVKEGIACHLAGGTHHAHYDFG